jgi:hypothetical protein
MNRTSREKYFVIDMSLKTFSKENKINFISQKFKDEDKNFDSKKKYSGYLCELKVIRIMFDKIFSDYFV